MVINLQIIWKDFFSLFLFPLGRKQEDVAPEKGIRVARWTEPGPLELCVEESQLQWALG